MVSGGWSSSGGCDPIEGEGQSLLVHWFTGWKSHGPPWENPSNPMESHQNHWKLDKDGEGGERLDFFAGLFWGLVDLVV